MDTRLAWAGIPLALSVALLLSFGSAACVSLAKPDPVEDACPTPNAATCVDHVAEKRDAGQGAPDVTRHDAAAKPGGDAREDGHADAKAPGDPDAASTLPEVSDDNLPEHRPGEQVPPSRAQNRRQNSKRSHCRSRVPSVHRQASPSQGQTREQSRTAAPRLVPTPR